MKAWTIRISVQSLFHVRLFATPWTVASQASLSIINSQSLLKLMSTELVMPSNHLILSSPSPPAFNLSQHQRSFPMSQFFPSGGQNTGSFSIGPSNEYSGLISFRMEWFDLLAVQGTIKSLLQHHSPKASILHRSAFFMTHLTHTYMTTGKTRALTIQTFLGQVMSLFCNMLRRLIIAFLPRSKCLLISCSHYLQ